MSNLPPGVTDSMIPGNRPENVLYDRVYDVLYDAVEGFGIDLDAYLSASGPRQDTFDALVSSVMELVQAARTEVE